MTENHPPTAATPENFRTVYGPPTDADREALALTFVDVLNQVWHHQTDVLSAAHRIAGSHHHTPEPQTSTDAKALDAAEADVRAALGTPPEPPTEEWEVTYSSAGGGSFDGYRIRRTSGMLPSRQKAEEFAAVVSNPAIRKRTKAIPAGPWEPFTPEETQDTTDRNDR
jgi:hypothetical protein